MSFGFYEMGVKKARIPFAAGVDLCSYEVNNKALSETGNRREKDEKGVYLVPVPVLCCRRNLYLRAHAAWCCWVRLQSESLLL